MNRAIEAAKTVWGGDPYLDRETDWDTQVIVAAHLHSDGDWVTLSGMIEDGWRPSDRELKLVDSLYARIHRNEDRKNEFESAKYSDDPTALPTFLDDQITQMTMRRLFR